MKCYIKGLLSHQVYKVCYTCTVLIPSAGCLFNIKQCRRIECQLTCTLDGRYVFAIKFFNDSQYTFRSVESFYSNFLGLFEAPIHHMSSYLMVQENIGAGSFGTVSRALRKHDGKTVALKKMRIGSKDRSGGLKVNGDLYVSVYRELKSLFQCSGHANIVKMDGIVSGLDEQYVMISMEFCQHSLYDMIQSHTYLPHFYDIKKMMVQILNGVSHIHANQIIHRDIKLENILVDYEGTLKIADLGVAKNNLKNDTMTPQKSTREYRAPEVLLNHFYHDKRPLDLWSCGVVFAELADPDGGLPFKGSNHIEQVNLSAIFFFISDRYTCTSIAIFI